MQLGIIGLPQTGKTTLFQALAGRQKAVSVYSSGPFEVHTAVVPVPDPRLDRLAAIFRPRKTVYAQVTFADIAGLDKGMIQKRTPRPFCQPPGTDGRLCPCPPGLRKPDRAFAPGVDLSFAGSDALGQ
jgi:hypothetical protein